MELIIVFISDLIGTFGRVYQGKLLMTVDAEEETATERDVLIKTVSGQLTE